MGRYTQRRRAASGPSPAAAPLPPPNLIEVHTGGGDALVVSFDGPITIDSGATPDSAFQVEGFDMASVETTVNPNACVVHDPNFFTAGSPWTLSAQPNWLLTPCVFPSSGVVT